MKDVLESVVAGGIGSASGRSGLRRGGNRGVAICGGQEPTRSQHGHHAGSGQRRKPFSASGLLDCSGVAAAKTRKLAGEGFRDSLGSSLSHCADRLTPIGRRDVLAGTKPADYLLLLRFPRARERERVTAAPFLWRCGTRRTGSSARMIARAGSQMRLSSSPSATNARRPSNSATVAEEGRKRFSDGRRATAAPTRQTRSSWSIAFRSNTSRAPSRP